MDYAIDLQSNGYCPCCRRVTLFTSNHIWLRDNYKCSNCGSIPRNRQLVKIINMYFKDIASAKVYEAGPCGPGSAYLRNNVTDYTISHYWPEVPRGQQKHGISCQDLEALTWSDNTFDLVVTQDVMEHVFHPEKAFKEIARVLKPDGYHIFTTPIWKNLTKTLQHAKMINHHIQYLSDPIYHGGFLVTFDWSYDIIDLISESSGMDTKVYKDVDQYLGIDGEFLDVLVSKKPTGNEPRMVNQ